MCWSSRWDKDRGRAKGTARLRSPIPLFPFPPLSGALFSAPQVAEVYQRSLNSYIVIFLKVMSGGGRTLTSTIDNISTHLHVNSRKMKWRGVARTHISEGVVYFVLSLRGGAGGRDVFWNIFYPWSGTKPQLLFSETKQAGLRASCLSLSLSLVSQRARSRTLQICGQASFRR